MNKRKIARYGWRPDYPDPRDQIWNKQNKDLIRGEEALARLVSYRNQMPPVWDQGQLGSCTGHGIAAALEFQQMRQGEAEGKKTPSRLFIYYGEREIEGTVNTDSGANIRDGIKVLASEGAPPESDWPYDISKFATPPPQTAFQDAIKYEALEYQSVRMGGPGAPIRSALNHAPIVFGFSVPDYFEGSWDAANEPLPPPDDSTQYIGGHCVLCVGYDWTLQRFKVPVLECRNSWGADWGDNGYFWMDYRWFKPNYVDDLWIVTKVK